MILWTLWQQRVPVQSLWSWKGVTLSWGGPMTRAHSLVASVLGLCLPRWPLRLSSTGSSL